MILSDFILSILLLSVEERNNRIAAFPQYTDRLIIRQYGSVQEPAPLMGLCTSWEFPSAVAVQHKILFLHLEAICTRSEKVTEHDLFVGGVAELNWWVKSTYSALPRHKVSDLSLWDCGLPLRNGGACRLINAIYLSAIYLSAYWTKAKPAVFDWKIRWREMTVGNASAGGGWKIAYIGARDVNRVNIIF